MSDRGGPGGPEALERVQLHLVLPYKFQPRDDARVRAHLAIGYRIEQLQRLTDREVIITLRRPSVVPDRPA